MRLNRKRPSAGPPLRRGGKTADERFDEGQPMRRVIRELTPPAEEMRPESRARIMSHLLEAQRGLSAGRDKPAGRVAWLKPAVAILTAAAVIAVVLVLAMPAGRRVTPPGLEARLRIRAGDVDVCEEGGPWRAAKDGQRLAAGLHIRTGAGSFAAVFFPEGSIMRLSDGSEAVLTRMGQSAVSVEHLKGGTYHRVHKRSDYSVVSQGVSAKALGTAFNVDNRVPDKLEILTVESAVQVGVGGQRPFEVPQGYVAVVQVTQKSAEVQPVSCERLQEKRLMRSAGEDANEGYPTGVYEEIGVQPGQSVPSEAPIEPLPPESTFTLGGSVSEACVSLDWGVLYDARYDRLVLLRSEGPEPVYPDDTLATYHDVSITSAVDDSVEQGITYQYRLLALYGSEVVARTNTVVVTVPAPETGPVLIELTASASGAGVYLEWGTEGTKRFEGYVIERVVKSAPADSSTPVGTATSVQLKSNAIVSSYTDGAVRPGHTYLYRVGLLVGGAVTVYSNRATVQVPVP